MRLLQQSKAARRDLLLAVGLGGLSGGLLVAQAWLLARAINELFFLGRPLVEVRTTLIGLGGVIAVRAGLTYLSTMLAGRAAGAIKVALRERVFRHVLALGPAYTAGERSGELAATLTEGIDALDTYIRDFIPRLALAAIVPLIILIVVFPTDLLSGVVLLITAPLTPLFMWLIGSTAGELAKRRWGLLSRMSAHFLDVLQGLTTLKLFGRARAQVEAIRVITGHFRQTTMEVLRVAFISALVLELVGTLSTALVAVEVGLRLLYGGLEFLPALFILILAPEFYLPLRALGASFHASTAGAAAAARIFEVLETPAPQPGSRTQAALSTIRFEGVHFAYEEGRPALGGLSLALEPGTSLALVGASGSGKSTVAALLLRFIEPSKGRITVGGTPLAAFDPAAWRQLIAWVPQHPTLFNASIAENIRLGRPGATPDEVAYAAQRAAAHAFIERLPQGYATPAGERGVRLSGGQLQRIALARAFLRDAPLLVLDEATANLDPATEARVQAAIHQLMAHRTALIIAHRLETIQRADRILVMEAGRIAEAGTHTDLLRMNGVYSGLIAAGG